MKYTAFLAVNITNIEHIQRLKALPPKVNLIEIHADSFEIEFIKVRKFTSQILLFANKSKSEGGRFVGSLQERAQCLIEASTCYDLIELEGERDLTPEILQQIPPEKRIISWQGETESYQALNTRLEHYRKIPARYYRLVTQSKKFGDELATVRLLNDYKGNDLIAYAIGGSSHWTQILAPFIGSPLVPSIIEADPQSDYLTPQRLIEDYNLPAVYSIKKVFGIVGNPVLNCISPRLHNAAYRALMLPYLYLPFQAESLRLFFNELINNEQFPFDMGGLTVISPFKNSSLKVVGSTCDPDVSLSKISNIIIKSSSWVALSTDTLGTIDALHKINANWQYKKIAIIGCGGTGRIVGAALKRMGSNLKIINRTARNGIKMANELGLIFVPLSQFNPQFFDIIIHATPLGKNPAELPFDVTQLTHHHAVIEYVYTLNRETDLVIYCRSHGIQVVDGKEMASLQTRHQFKFMTGVDRYTEKPPKENRMKKC